jgi:dihydrofolate reductase
MIISIIAAMDRNHLIGNKNQLPWHLPADFAHFKSVTMGKPIIMGRKTYESIGKPLPGRKNIVLSRNTDVRYEGVVCVNSINEALAEASEAEEVMIIGGSSLYEMLLGLVDRLYITYVDAEFEGDAWFPKIDPHLWLEKESVTRQADEKNVYDCRFVTLEKVVGMVTEKNIK